MARRVKISCVETSRLFQKISEEYGFTNEVVMSWMPLVAGNDKGATCHAPTDFRRGQACLTRISPTPFYYQKSIFTVNCTSRGSPI